MAENIIFGKSSKAINFIIKGFYSLFIKLAFLNADFATYLGSFIFYNVFNFIPKTFTGFYIKTPVLSPFGLKIIFPLDFHPANDFEIFTDLTV
jgi:hypothetical protein